MSKHSKTIVPIEAWAFNSPDLLKDQSVAVDIGNLAEALIYYDSVLLVPGTERHFALFLQWFIERNKLDELLCLISDGTIEILHYAFFTAPILKDNTYSIWNIDDPSYQKGNSFFPKLLYHDSVSKLIPKSRNREKLYKAFEGKVVELRPDTFRPAIDNATADFTSPERSAFALQTFINELYRIRSLGRPPKVTASASVAANGTSLHFNINFEELTKLAGSIGFNQPSTISAFAHNNRAIWSAATLNCDLYQSSPMALITRDKFSEIGERSEKKAQIVDELQKEVEFPDVRRLVNTGEIPWELAMEFRKKGKKFREWLTGEAERDRNAMIAYHEELSKDMGLTKYARKTLSMFGVVGSAAASTYAGAALAGPMGAAAGAVVGAVGGEAIKYLLEVTAQLGTGWKPVVFGKWMAEKIEDEKEST